MLFDDLNPCKKRPREWEIKVQRPKKEISIATKVLVFVCKRLYFADSLILLDMDVKTDAGVSITLTDHPDDCPFCHRTFVPKPIYAYRRDVDDWDVFMLCPNKACKRSFVAYYHARYHNHYDCYLTGISKGTIIGRTFPDAINTISPSFSIIYNQAYAAEQDKLYDICGMGYRKALEFLIKDFVIKANPDKEAEITKELLGPCITKYVTNDKIKSVAERAAWLGNDETHYVRRWADKNLNDLKKLIDLTVHWIEMEILTESIELDMPNPKASKK